MERLSDDKEAQFPWLKGVKIFVIGAGVVLVLGTAALVALVIQRAQAPQAERASDPADEPLAAEDEQLKPVWASVTLPEGARVTGASLDGASILLTLELPGGKQYLAILDSASGRQRLLVDLQPEAR